MQSLDLGSQIRRLPLIAAIEAGDFSVRVQQRGAKVVDDLTVLRFIRESEVFGSFANITGFAGGKAPVLEGWVNGSGISLAVVPQNIGIIVSWGQC